MAEFTADIGGLASLVLGLNLLAIITCLRRIFNYISEVSNSLRDLTFIRSAIVSEGILGNRSSLSSFHRDLCKKSNNAIYPNDSSGK